jgi:GTP-binding protein HflX
VGLTSATEGSGIEALLALVDRRLLASHEVREVEVPVGDGQLLAWLHEHCEVLAREDREQSVHLRLAYEPRFRMQLENRIAGLS